MGHYQFHAKMAFSFSVPAKRHLQENKEKERITLQNWCHEESVAGKSPSRQPTSDCLPQQAWMKIYRKLGIAVWEIIYLSHGICLSRKERCRPTWDWRKHCLSLNIASQKYQGDDWGIPSAVFKKKARQVRRHLRKCEHTTGTPRAWIQVFSVEDSTWGLNI